MDILMLIVVMIPISVTTFILTCVLMRRRALSKICSKIPEYLLSPYGMGYFLASEYAKLLIDSDHTFKESMARKYSAPKLSRTDIEAINEYLNNKDNENFDKDPIRMVNAKASLYKIQIPEDALFVDDRSTGFLTWLMNTLEPVTPIKDIKAKEYGDPCLPIKGGLYLTQGSAFVNNVALVYLYRTQEEQGTPYAQIEWTIARRRASGIERHLGVPRELVTIAIIQSTLTAYAIHNGIKIPRDYIRYDEVTIHFLQSLRKVVVVEKPSHLRLV